MTNKFSILFFIIFLSGLIASNSAKGQNTKESNQKQNDTVGQKRFIAEMTAKTGMNERQALIVRNLFLTNKRQERRMMHDSSLTLSQKQERLKIMGMNSQNFLIQLLTEQQLNLLKQVANDSEEKKKVKENTDEIFLKNKTAISHPIKGGIYKGDN